MLKPEIKTNLDVIKEVTKELEIGRMTLAEFKKVIAVLEEE